MTKSPGQSAMEYLLSYGWAILVVMVVGIVMWQIGIFNIGGSIPTTSDGFAQLKPMLATCKMTEAVYFPAGSWDGFQCMFTNPLQTRIAITGINVTVDGKYCAMGIYVDQNPAYNSTSYSIVVMDCPTVDSCDTPECYVGGGGNACTCVGQVPDCGLVIPADSTFFVNLLGSPSGFGPCSDIDIGKRYEAFIDITYNISMLGETVTKHSTGHIRGSME